MNTNVLKDFNAFYLAYWADPAATKLALINDAAKLILELYREGDYKLADLLEYGPDYMELCDMLGWPCFGEGGLFEQCLDAGKGLALTALGFRPKA